MNQVEEEEVENSQEEVYSFDAIEFALDKIGAEDTQDGKLPKPRRDIRTPTLKCGSMDTK